MILPVRSAVWEKKIFRLNKQIKQQKRADGLICPSVFYIEVYSYDGGRDFLVALCGLCWSRTASFYSKKQHIGNEREKIFNVS